MSGPDPFSHKRMVSLKGHFDRYPSFFSAYTFCVFYVYFSLSISVFLSFTQVIGNDTGVENELIATKVLTFVFFALQKVLSTREKK